MFRYCSLSCLIISGFHEGCKGNVFVNPVSYDGNSFSHCKCGNDCTNTKSNNVSKTEVGYACCNEQTDHIEADLDSGIWFV